jgi:DNA-binding CsgD family transcriptional regulator
MASDESRLLNLIGDVHGLLELEEFHRGLVVALQAAIPSDWVSINEIGPEPGEFWGMAEPQVPMEMREIFALYMHQNPLVAYMMESRRGSARRLSEMISFDDFHKLEVYRRFYGPLGIEHQIAFTLPQEPPRLLGVALSRRRGDFDDGDRDLLNEARPYLIQSYRNAIAYESLRREARQTLREPLLGAGLTPREAEVIDLLAHGCSNADIATRLGVSLRTAEKHAQNAFAKLGVHDRSAASSRAWELGGSPG